MKKTWLLPVLGVATAVLIVAVPYPILRFAPAPVEVMAATVIVLLIVLAVLGYFATKRGQAAAFVVIALLLPYALFSVVAAGSAERLSDEFSSLFDLDEDTDEDALLDERLFDEDPLTGEDNSDIGYGSDPELDALQDRCLEGDNQACTELFFQAPEGSEYESVAQDNLTLE